MVKQHGSTPPSGRKRAAKRTRTSGVGRTGARFPATGEVAEPEGAPAGDVVSDSTSQHDVGRTGARFGPYSVRKPGHTKRSGSSGSARDGDQVEAVVAGGPTAVQSAERTVPMIKPWSGALVRPYAHTGGRTRSSHDLALEALISSSTSAGAGAAALTTHHRRLIVELCVQPRSVAEVAALLSVPLGVAQVLLGDLATEGAIIVHPTAGTIGDGAPDVAFMHRVLVGLRRL